MKKRDLRKIIFSFCAVLLCVFLINFLSAQLVVTLYSPPSYGQDNQSQVYDIGVNNTYSSPINFTMVSIIIPANIVNLIYSYNATVNGTASSTQVTYLGAQSLNFSWINSSATGGLISSGGFGFFWINASLNQTGYSNITVMTLDSLGNTNSTNVTILINDTILPNINFVSPTPATQSILNYSYIPINVTAIDSGTGLKNITIYVYNSSNILNQTITSTSSPTFNNFTSLPNGIYYINATAFDNANNSNSTGILTIQISVSNSSSCRENWTCAGASYWSACNSTTYLQTCTNLIDLNSCGTSVNKTANISQACTPSSNCTPAPWACGNWTPTICPSSGTQTRTCTDPNNCLSQKVESRSCVVGSNSLTNSSSQQTGASASSLSLSSPFFIVLAIIILSVVGVVVILIRLRRKSYSTDFGNFRGSNGNQTYPASGPPPSYPYQ